MKSQEFHEKLSRLQVMIAIQDAKIMADPLRYLDDMSSRCSAVLRLLEDVEWALNGHTIADYCAENAIEPFTLQGEALVRCNAALNLIREYNQT